MTMREDDLSQMLLVEACEQSDPERRFITASERAVASRRAGQQTGASAGSQAALSHEDPAWMAARAAALAADLCEAHPALRRARAAASLPVPGWLLVAAAFLLGLGLDALGSARQVSLLSFPLLGLLAWNAVVYAHVLVRWLTRREAGVGTTWLAVAARWVRLRGSGEETTQGARAWQARSVGLFFEAWGAHAGRLLAARSARMLHTMAAATAFGVLCGMYVAGFAFEYRATWESTFLDAGQVHGFLAALLAPAAGLLGIAVPDASTVAALRAPSDGPAATWIHLWAATATLAIVLPRVALAAVSTAAEHRAARALTFDLGSPYARRLLAPDRGAHTEIDVLPYSYRPSPQSQERQRELLLELFGNRARIGFREPIAYGDDLPVAGSTDGDRAEGGAQRCQVLVFNLAQSPEQEVHGELLEAAKEHASDGEQLLVILDEEHHARHVAPEASETRSRLDQRRRAWERVLRSCDLAACVLEDGAGIDDATLRAAAAGLWPAEEGEVA